MPWLSHTFLLVHLNIMWKNCPLPHTVLENVLRLKPFMTSLFGKVAAWLWKLWRVPTTGSPLCPSFEGQSCAHYDAVLCHPKSQYVWRLTVCQSCQIPFLREKKERKKSFSVDPRLSHLTTLWFIPSSYSAWMSSRICRELGVVQGFGTIEINGLHRTFHNIIKSEMFWTENLLLDYKVSLIVLPPSSLTLLQTTASKSSVTFM